MIHLLLLAALGGLQGEDSRVAALVAGKDYEGALELAMSTGGADRASLETWLRHQAGDLAGALSSARAGLEQAPSDLRLLEQAAFICGSLMLAEEALDYSERMLALGDARGGDLREHALELMAERERVERSVLLSYGVIAAAALGSILLGRSALSSRVGLEAPASPN